ncbi:hypothetical protein ACJMK2_002053 [Sinanodonta woodiana]|uniref:Uncharacterized protein n=1 Tax=Sinanodonta woodiana TaxID=1069815 RepID=A0ABD3XU48_SINWO
MCRNMRNKRVFSWMILLVLMEYTLSEDLCKISPLLGQLSFGSFLPRSVFTTKYQISIYQCATECQLRRQRCKSFNYRRSALSCQLCEEDSGPGGINLQAKAGTDHSNIDTWTNISNKHCSERNCSWTERCNPSNFDPQTCCVKTECPFVVLKPGVTIHPSNETAVGTKARYRCVSEDMERGSYLTTCLASTAAWYPTDFKCVCKTPIAMSGTIAEPVEVEVGQNYTYRCQNGLIGRRDLNPTVTCLPDGDWTTTNFTCVCKTPIALSGTIIVPVEVAVGQNYTYRCQNGLIGRRDLNPTVTCLPDGDWTTTNFTCVCKTPVKSGAINQTTEVEIGENYTYICQHSLFEKGNQTPTVTCLHDGNWTTTNFICVTQNWAQDTIYPKNIHRSDVISNVPGTDLWECMQQCDDKQTECLSFFYDNLNNHCVLSSSFKRGSPQGFQFPDELVYYTAPSTECDMGYMNILLGGFYLCIKYHQEKKVFDEAMKVCESEKAKLLVVTNEFPINELMNIIKTCKCYCIQLNNTAKTCLIY